MEPKDRIIVALDMDSLGKMTPYVEALAPYVGCFKIGLEILTAVGAQQVVQHVHRLGGQVFLDGKFSDIPNTVAGASRAAASLGVKMFNVHASCGIESVRAAVDNKGGSELLVVSVLTSMNEETCRHVFGTDVPTKVAAFAKDAVDAGADGIICSPQELELLARSGDFSKLSKVTPGVRPAWYDSNDQKRTLTPLEAVKMGATQLVIGRPITNPPRGIGGPVDAAKKILEEIAGA